MMLIDSHCHLYLFPDPHKIILEAIEAGVTKIVCVSENLDSMKKILELKENFPENIFVGMAIHPADLVTMSKNEVEETLDFMEKHLEQIDVIGESGLDYKCATTEDEKNRQKEIFHHHFHLANQAKIG